jgi:ribosomal protein S18 acetylase RimI-like enzyme
MEVRLATRQDLAAIAEVHVRSWQETYIGQVPQDHLDSLSVDQRRQTWTNTYDRADDRAAIFVLVVDGAVVGFAHECPSRDPDAPPGVGEVTSIYLRGAHWGRGGGRALMDGALNGLAERGFTEAILWVLETNTRARHFYETTGWVADGSQKLEAIGRANVTEVRYRRFLTP